MVIDYKALGRRIREVRKKKGITQEELSYAIDVSVVYLSRVETGSGAINLKRLAQISHVLDVPVGELLSGSSVYEKSYLNKEFEVILSQCSPVKQRLILELAKLVLESKIEDKSTEKLYDLYK